MTTYTQLARLPQMTPFDPALKNAWGPPINSAWSAVEQLAAGNGPIDLTGLATYSVTVANDSTDQARQAMLPFIGTVSAPCTVTIPPISRIGWVSNGTSATLTLTAGGTVSLTIPVGVSLLYTVAGNAVTAVPIGFAGSSNVNGNLAVSGSLTVAGPASIAGKLTATNASITAITAFSTAAGTLTATSAAVSGTLGAGIATVSGTLTAANATVSGTLTSTNVNTGSLTVSGASNLHATSITNLSVSGSTSFNSLAIAGSLSSGTLGVTGNANVSGNVVSGGVVTGAASFSVISVSSNVNANGLILSGNASIAGAVFAASFNTTSDRRSKTQIEDITVADANAWVRAGRARTYVMDGRKQSGFIAQEDIASGRGLAVHSIATADGERFTRNYNQDVAYLTQALAAALDRIDALEAARAV